MDSSPAAGINQLQQIFLRIIGLLVGVGFVALLVMLIFGGIRYLTSGGEEKALATSRQTITWAILGVIFLALAWLILNLIQAFTGVQVTNFCLEIDLTC